MADSQLQMIEASHFIWSAGLLLVREDARFLRVAFPARRGGKGKNPVAIAPGSDRGLVADSLRLDPAEHRIVV